MNTLRHYFVSDDLDDLDLLEQELEAGGVENLQIHVLSNDDLGVANHIHLHAVQSLFKSDVIRSGEIGAIVGLMGAAIIIVSAYLLGLPQLNVGWMPYIFLSVVVFGFSTWEGGFIGFQRPNRHYKEFQAALAEGMHVFIVELDPEQEPVLERLLLKHQRLEEKGTEIGQPHWVLYWRNHLYRWIDRNLFSHAQVEPKSVIAPDVEESSAVTVVPNEVGGHGQVDSELSRPKSAPPEIA